MCASCHIPLTCKCVTWPITLALHMTWTITHDVSNFTTLHVTCHITVHYTHVYNYTCQLALCWQRWHCCPVESVEVGSCLHNWVPTPFCSQISNKGFNVNFNDGRCHISFDSRVVAYGTLRKSLYYLDLHSTSSDIACVASMQLWQTAQTALYTFHKRSTISLYLKGLACTTQSQCRRLWSLDSRASHGPIPKPRTNLPPTFRIDKPSVA